MPEMPQKSVEAVSVRDKRKEWKELQLSGLPTQREGTPYAAQVLRGSKEEEAQGGTPKEEKVQIISQN
jgi:hypothetical protein